MLLIQCFYFLLTITNLFRARENAAKCSISSQKCQNFMGRGSHPSAPHGIAMFLPKTNSLSTILDPPLTCFLLL